MKRKILYLTLIVVMTAIACKKKETYDPCKDPNLVKHNTTFDVTGTNFALNNNIRALKENVQASADSCQVEKIFIKIDVNTSNRGAPSTEELYNILWYDIFIISPEKIRGIGTLTVLGVFSDIKLALENMGYVVVAEIVEERS
jgi:hypothetical protein